MNRTRVGKVLNNLNKLKWDVTYKGILIGIAAGILVVLYRLGIEFGTETAVGAYAALRAKPILLL
ncbi:MAG TPA: ClC family H(+)/Cl(-) exchange transporter, partial [Candidatus Limiplasma sp.]|nr:ClC family H(+)/Cl(-) exchange transporter [Candidatus Limiplasma sp.]